MKINPLKFKTLIAKKNHTQLSLSKELNIPKSNINGWVNRETIPNKYITSVNKALGVDLESYFLVDGIDLVDDLSNGKTPIPFYGEVDISAGDLSFWNDNTIYEPTARYILPESNADFILPVIGNSMSPNIDSGDKIAVKEISDMSIIFYGAVYVVITEDYRFVKVIRKHSNDDTIILHSYNNDYDDVYLPKKKIIKMFTVQEVLKKIQ